jgi:hypothetical protein
VTVTHYNSSKGPKLIADMPYAYLRNAINVVEGQLALGMIGREAELAAMVERRTALDREFAEREAQQVGVGA